jgi:hypothetical protein
MVTDHVLSAGDLAFYETLRSGMLPVSVQAITKDGDELVARLKVTASRGPYVKGETLHIRAGLSLHSRKAVSIRRQSHTVTGRTIHVPDDEMQK